MVVPLSALPAVGLADGHAHRRKRPRAKTADAADRAGMVLPVDPRAATVGSPLSAAGPDEFTARAAGPTHLLSRRVLRGHADQRTRPDTRRRPKSNSAETSDRISEPA